MLCQLQLAKQALGALVDDGHRRGPVAHVWLTTKQADGNVKAGGMNQLFYVNQIINLLENDLLDFSNVRLTDRLQYLKELLPEKVRDLELAA
jgi:hypothetical protein